MERLLLILASTPLLVTMLVAAPPGDASQRYAGLVPDTTDVPPDSLEFPEQWEEPYETIEYEEEGGEPLEDTWNLFELPAWIGLGFGGGFCATGHYESMIGGAITFGKAIGDNGWLELSAGYTATPLQQTSLLRESINDNPGMLSFAGNARAFLTSADQPVRYYVLFGLGMDFLLWTYDEPINTANDEGGVDYVYDDAVPGIDIHLGIGFMLHRESGVLVFAELVPGVKLWFDETSNGFTNDLFSNYGYAVLKIQAALEIGG